jgi:formyl-CoA transferase
VTDNSHRDAPVEPDGQLPLRGLRVLDAATLFAGPLAASILGDFGADVIKIEHPEGDSLRTLGWERDGIGLWWTVVSRNKRSVTLNLSHPHGQAVFRKLVAHTDVLIEGFRPGTFERWGIAPSDLLKINPGLVVVRVSGFGQTGPYSPLPGFGTLAEAMSGFASLNGAIDGPPTLPPFALADGVAGITGALAAMMALRWRDAQPEPKRSGQIIDLPIYEPLFWLLGPYATVWDQLGTAPERTGNRAPFTAPRNLYQTKDGRWLAVSASAQSIAERVMRIVGRPDVIEQSWFGNHRGRVEHSDELDRILADWIAERSAAEVLEAFADGHAAIAPVYDIRDIVNDPHYRETKTLVTVEHPKLGPVLMQNVLARLSDTPGAIRTPAPDLGEHNREVMVGELGLSAEEMAALYAEGVVSEQVEDGTKRSREGAGGW